MARVTWRGVEVDDRTRDMLLWVARLTPDTPRINPLQGSYSNATASAGTHSGGGAVDTGTWGWSQADKIELVRVMRTVGFAAWLRLTSDGPWVEHVHAIAVDCPDLSAAAAAQVQDLRNGRNGLADNAPDPHAALGIPVTSWEQYQEGDGIVALPRKGDRGESVEVIQRMLVATGHDTIPAGADGQHRYDGVYGDWTQDAVVDSRRDLGAGNPGSQTRITPWHYMALIRALGRG